jgi:hypothetical protein
MAAKIRINADRSRAEFITPEGTVHVDDLDQFDGDGESVSGILTVLGDVAEDSVVYVGVAGEYEGLQANTIYRLSPIRTELEENALIEEDDEDGDDDGDEDDTLPV